MSRLHRYVSHGQSCCAHVLGVLCKMSVASLCRNAHGWIFLGIRANFEPKPPRLASIDDCVSCPWKMVVVVTERLYKALGRDRGSSVFLMAPEHLLEVRKGRAGCFCLVTPALGFELPQSCSAAVWHSNTSTPCPQASDTIWFHSDVSRFMFSSCLGCPLTFPSPLSMFVNFQVFQLVRVATRYLHLWTASGSSWAHWMFGRCVFDCFRACLQVIRKLCFCVKAHQRCDAEQHLKSCGSRRAAKRDADGWLVVSVRLFSGCGTSTCLLGNVWTFLPSLHGGHNFIIVSLGRVCHQSASVFTCLSVLFNWKVLVGERVVVPLSTWCSIA